MVKSKTWIFQKRFDGFPKDGDVELVNEEIPPIKNGEFLTEAVYIGVDPGMRALSRIYPLGTTFRGEQLAIIKESKNEKYAVGKYVVGNLGWRSHTIFNDATVAAIQPFTVLPDFGNLPLSLAVGALGISGNTAYFGFLEICKPKAGETVVISASAGAVGNHVGQIAKIYGCKVIGIAGTDEKGKWLTEELGFDGFVNYKTQNFEESLKKAAPSGIDCYFDNTGGEISAIVLKQMNTFGRIAVCGYISAYNNIDRTTPVLEHSVILMKQLKIEGLVVYRWNNRWLEGIMQNMAWIREGKLKYKETIYEGFENMFQAFQDVLKGGNMGKAVVKVCKT